MKGSTSCSSKHRKARLSKHKRRLQKKHGGELGDSSKAEQDPDIEIDCCEDVEDLPMPQEFADASLEELGLWWDIAKSHKLAFMHLISKHKEGTCQHGGAKLGLCEVLQNQIWIMKAHSIKNIYSER